MVPGGGGLCLRISLLCTGRCTGVTDVLFVVVVVVVGVIPLFCTCAEAAAAVSSIIGKIIISFIA
jgi:hypothetical protein